MLYSIYHLKGQLDDQLKGQGQAAIDRYGGRDISLVKHIYTLHGYTADTTSSASRRE
jgi:hypothetical protein